MRDHKRLTKAMIRRLELIATRPRSYMTGGQLNERLEHGGYITKEGEGLWVKLTITPAGHAALLAVPSPTSPGAQEDRSDG